MSMKDFNDTIRNRTRNLLACSAVPQPTAALRAPTDILLLIYFLFHAQTQYLEAQHIWANMQLLQFLNTLRTVMVI